MSKTLADFLSERFEELGPMAFYRDLFPVGSFQELGTSNDGKPNGIVLGLSGNKMDFRHIVRDDLCAIGTAIQTDSLVLVSPLGYFGQRNLRKNARTLHAITFDLDGIIWKDGKPQGLSELLYQFEQDFLPTPTYLVASGTGLHLYYQLEKTLRLFPEVYEGVRHFRFELTTELWNSYVTDQSATPQYESVVQGFRAVGSLTKDGKHRVRAFRVGKLLSTELLNGYIEDEKFRLPKQLSLEEAKELYPDWFQRRIVDKQPLAGSRRYITNRGFYDWFKKQILWGTPSNIKAKQQRLHGVREGNRYYSIYCLSAVAYKCGISQEELEKDALELVEPLNRRTQTPNNTFTAQDALTAIQAYSDKVVLMKRETLSFFTGLELPANKRNHRPQSLHLKIARSTKEILNLSGVGNAKNAGRPKGSGTKQQQVLDYKSEHPQATVREIASALGCSKNTVCKWLRIEREKGQE